MKVHPVRGWRSLGMLFPHGANQRATVPCSSITGRASSPARLPIPTGSATLHQHSVIAAASGSVVTVQPGSSMQTVRPIWPSGLSYRVHVGPT